MSSMKGLTMLNDQDFSRNRFSKNNSSNKSLSKNSLSRSKLSNSNLSNNKLTNQTALAKRVATGVVLGFLLLQSAACSQEAPSVLGTV